MRRHLRRLLAALDGTPTGTRGQSLVEMTVTLPIFLVMLAGMIEVGWFANNYLILSDVVRTAGRFGSVRDPLLWEEGQEKNYHRLDCDLSESTYSKSNTQTSSTPPASLPGFFAGSESEGDLGYYDGVACSAIINMAPLEIKDDEDDIIVSVIGYSQFPINCDFNPNTPNPNCTELRVTGRYPAGQNECGSGDYRDPFDADGDGQATVPEDSERYDAGSDGIRGYVFRGNHEKDGCIGSEFDLRWIEERLRRSVMQTTNRQTGEAPPMPMLEQQYIPNFGLILVEISWNSYQLLNLPFFNYIGNPIRIHVWSIFPVSAAEPDF